MPITRRTALHRMFIVAGGVVLLPACGRNSDNRDENDETLEAFADTLLPAGATASDQTLGAKATGARQFVARMIRDCFPKDEQEKYMRGLEAFNQQARDRYGKPFARCDQSQRDALVSAIDASTSNHSSSAGGKKAAPNDRINDDLSFFFRNNKGLLIEGYLGSEYFLTKIEVYELVPGRWHGCVPVVNKS